MKKKNNSVTFPNGSLALSYIKARDVFQCSYTSISPLTPARQKCFTSFFLSLFLLFSFSIFFSAFYYCIDCWFFRFRFFSDSMHFPSSTNVPANYAKGGHIKLEVINVCRFSILCFIEIFPFFIAFSNGTLQLAFFPFTFQFGPFRIRNVSNIMARLYAYKWLIVMTKKEEWCDNDGNDYDDDESTTQ